MIRLRDACVLIGVGVAVLAFAACGEADRAEEVTPARPAVVTPVSVRDFEDHIEASGELLAKNRAAVAAQVAGEITEIILDEGDTVEEGQVVLEIDPERRHLDLDHSRHDFAIGNQVRRSEFTFKTLTKTCIAFNNRKC